MPVGGIGAGQLYLCGDGTLGNWEIFNQWKGVESSTYTGKAPSKLVDQGFAVVLQINGQRATRALNAKGFKEVAFNGQYPVGTILYRDPESPVEATMEAFSPFIPLNAKDSGLPVTVFRITLKNTSPNPVNAGLLGWLENAICLNSANEAPGLRRTRLINEKGRTMVVHAAEDAPPPAAPPAERPDVVLQDFEGANYGTWTPEGAAFGAAPAKGALPGQQPVTGFQGTGLVNSFTGGDDAEGTLTSPPFPIDRRNLNFFIGGGNRPGEACVNLIVDGKVVRSATGKNAEALSLVGWGLQGLEGKQGVIQIVDHAKGGWGHINADQFVLSDKREGALIPPIAKFVDFGTMVLTFAEESGDPVTAQQVFGTTDGPQNKVCSTNADPYAFPEKRNGALLTSQGDIAPGAQRTFTFVLAWHFPNIPNGHEYVARFPDASTVAHYVLDNLERLSKETFKWRDTYYDSTLPFWLLDRLHAPVSTLATGTCQWWQNGRFYAYEGVVCCEGTCTHVWNYEHAEARLFPELTRSVREMQDFADAGPPPAGGGFHPDTGLVGFRCDDKYAADGQCGTVLKAYREHQISPNPEFLGRIYPKAKKALEYLIAQDALPPGAPDDGLIENTQPNTYDINFEGPNTFIGSLYLAALRAGEVMAREAGDTAFADRAKAIFDSGVKLSMERLWNGEYFIQQVDLAKFPEFQYGPGCLSDQLFGQSWARQLALGSIYPEANVKQALASIWKYNWAPDVGPYNNTFKPSRIFAAPSEAGLFVCTWPKSAHLDKGVLYRDEVWTGIEYQVASNMVWEGMLTEGLAICRGVHERYNPGKRNPYNEIECSDHYARALASWGVLTALEGFEYHGPRGHMVFAPRISPENFKAAFTAAEGWGSFAQKREGNKQNDTIALAWGKLVLKDLVFMLPGNVPVTAVVVKVGPNPVEMTQVAANGLITITFPNGLTLNTGETLDVAIN